jgi:hypothetical protein
VPELLHLHAGCGQQQVYVHSKVYCEEVCPSAKLDTWLQKISPVAAAANNSSSSSSSSSSNSSNSSNSSSGSGAILPLGSRDVLPGARQVTPKCVTVFLHNVLRCARSSVASSSIHQVIVVSASQYELASLTVRAAIPP